MMDTKFCILLLAVCAADAVDQRIVNIYHHWYQGDGTYYGVGQGGMCQLNAPTMPPVALSPKIKHLVALNSQQMFGSLSCGMCVRVRANGQGLGNDPITGDFIVYVKDLCPECKAGSLDFAVNGDGRWHISMQAVQCPVGNTKIEYKFQGSNPWYLKLQTRNERVPTSLVSAYQPKHGHWANMKRSSDGFWLIDASIAWDKPVQFPLHVRLTSANGKQVDDHVPRLANDVVLHGDGVQYAIDNTIPSA